tara:strand:+ start:964 stop:1161 length:198 start_codon:yes stop_codon:yes gene_type:complete
MPSPKWLKKLKIKTENNRHIRLGYSIKRCPVLTMLSGPVMLRFIANRLTKVRAIVTSVTDVTFGT